MRSITWARAALASLATLATLAACSSEVSTGPATQAGQRPSLSVGTVCNNVRGSVVGYFVSNLEIEGTISGDVAGQAFATIQSAEWRKNDKSADVALTHRYVTPEGEIFTSDTGTLKPIAEAIDGYYNWYEFDNRLTVVGGTGAYEGATGSMRASGLVNPYITPTGYGPAGVQLTYMGRVCVLTTVADAEAP